ncbi:hypothetical protein AT6N2_C2987 [Agrobacterium tumefaciens]|nr:hypothetical protein AT6N2_C2987 [Agrobacterium tumefaciens]
MPLSRPGEFVVLWPLPPTGVSHATRAPVAASVGQEDFGRCHVRHEMCGVTGVQRRLDRCDFKRSSRQTDAIAHSAQLIKRDTDHALVMIAAERAPTRVDKTADNDSNRAASHIIFHLFLAGDARKTHRALRPDIADTEKHMVGGVHQFHLLLEDRLGKQLGLEFPRCQKSGRQQVDAARMNTVRQERGTEFRREIALARRASRNLHHREVGDRPGQRNAIGGGQHRTSPGHTDRIAVHQHISQNPRAGIAKPVGKALLVGARYDERTVESIFLHQCAGNRGAAAGGRADMNRNNAALPRFLQIIHDCRA